MEPEGDDFGILERAARRNHQQNEDDFIMDADYMPGGEKYGDVVVPVQQDKKMSKKKKNKKNKKKLDDALLQEALPAATSAETPAPKSLDEYLDEYYQLDYEDMVCRRLSPSHIHP